MGIEQHGVNMRPQNFIRQFKLKITPETLAAYKAARRRNLIHRGRPVPDVLLRSQTSEKQ